MTITNLRAFQGLDRDLRAALLAQIRDLWTHTSTALEGNTLTLGETKFVIEEGRPGCGMTGIAFKPLLSLFSSGSCRAGDKHNDRLLDGIAHPSTDRRHWIISQRLLRVRTSLSTDGEAMAAILATDPERRRPWAQIAAARCQEAGQVGGPAGAGATGDASGRCRSLGGGGIRGRKPRADRLGGAGT